MADLVDPDKIEALVGAKRHNTRHIIRGDYGTGLAYILHPVDCLARYEDLRDCPWSLALDRGDAWLPDGHPHYVNVRDGQLVADLAPLP